MEATGYYHYCLAQYLYEKGYAVSGCSLIRKTFYPDETIEGENKSDAKSICEYARSNEVPLCTTAKDKSQAECLQLLRLMDTYIEHLELPRKNKLDGERF